MRRIAHGSALNQLAVSLNATGAGSLGWSYPAAADNQGPIGWTSGSSAALYGLLEAQAAYIPVSAQTFTPYLEVELYKHKVFINKLTKFILFYC